MVTVMRNYVRRYTWITLTMVAMLSLVGLIALKVKPDYAMADTHSLLLLLLTTLLLSLWKGINALYRTSQRLQMMS